MANRVSRGFKPVFVIFRLFSNNCLEFIVLYCKTCLVNVGTSIFPILGFSSAEFFLASVLTVFVVNCRSALF